MARREKHEVYTLLVEVGRAADDDLPDGSTGGAMLCYSGGIDADEAVREAVAILKQAGLAPLEVTNYGTLTERENAGQDISDEERTLVQRALDDNAVIVAETTPFYD